MKMVKEISKLLFSLLLLYLISENIDLQSLKRSFLEIESVFIFFAIMPLILQIFLATKRWQIIINDKSSKLNFFIILRYLWVGLFFNQALPSNIGGDGMRIFLLNKKSKIGLGESTKFVLIDRLFGVFSLILIVLVVYLLSFDLLSEEIRDFLPLLITPLIITLILFFLIERIEAFFNIKNRHFLWLLDLVKTFKYSLLNIRSSSKLLPLSIVIHFLTILTMYYVARALSIDINITILTIVVPVAILMMALPISFAGWGVREGVLVYGLSFYNIPLDSALAVSILFGLMGLVLSIPGLFFFLFNKKN